MIKREILFDRLWSDLESGAASQDAVFDRALPVGLDGPLTTASALKSYGMATPTVELDGMWRNLRPKLQDQHARAIRPVRLRATRTRWPLRIAAAVAAAVLLLTAMARQAVPGSNLYPVRLTMERVALAFAPNSGTLHLRIAEARLQDLLEALRAGPVAAGPGLARALVSNRNAARSDGADVSRLDASIASEVPPALTPIPAAIAQQIRSILRGVLPPPASSDPTGTPPPVAGESGSRTGSEGPRQDEGTGARRQQGGGGENDSSQEQDRGGSGSGGSGSGSGEGSPSESPGSGSGSGGSGGD